MNPQRILVTGGAGFIGSHTVDLLLQQNKQVVVLDNLFSGDLKNLNLQHPDLEFIEGDVLEYPYLLELVADTDAVLHLAAIASVPITLENPIYSFQVNIQGFLHVLEAVQKTTRPIRVVYASSAAVYGEPKELPCRDDLPLTSEPLSPYALQKIQAEEYAELYSRLYGIESLALRYFNVYGERQNPNSPYSGVISRFINAYKNDQKLTIFGDGLQSRDFIHVSDVAIANSLALQSDYAGALNIATGLPHTLLQLVEYIQAAGEKSATLEFGPPRVGDVQTSLGTNEMALTHLGFKNAVPLSDGIKWLLQNVKSDCSTTKP